MGDAVQREVQYFCVCAGNRNCMGTRREKSTFKWFWVLYRMYENPGLNRQLVFFLLILQVVWEMKTFADA